MLTEETDSSLHEVLADPNARWSDIRKAMRNEHVCTHGGLSQVIKNTTPASISKKSNQEEKIKVDKDRLERDLKMRKKHRFNPFGLSQELMTRSQNESKKAETIQKESKKVETSQNKTKEATRRRSSKCDFGIGLGGQELKECHYSSQRRKMSLTLEDLEMSSEFEYDYDASCDAEDMQASGLGGYFMGDSFKVKKVNKGSTKNLFKLGSFKNSSLSNLDSSSQRTQLASETEISGSELSFSNPQMESINKPGKVSRSPPPTATEKKIVKKQETTYSFENQGSKSQGDLFTKFFSSFQNRNDEHKSEANSKSNSPSQQQPEQNKRRYPRRSSSMDMIKHTFGYETNQQPSSSPLPPPPEQNRRRFHRRSMDMLKQTFGTDTNSNHQPAAAATPSPPKQNGGIFNGLRVQRTRSMDMVNHVDTDTVRRAMFNVMTGQGKTRRQQSMEDMPNCDTGVKMQETTCNMAQCSSVA